VRAWRLVVGARYSTRGAPKGEPSFVPDSRPSIDRRRVAASSTAFPRAQRLTSGQEYTRVFGGADRSADRFFTVLAKLNEFSHARLGLAISRRVAPRAVDRNRIRRLARESFRHLDLAPLDYVVMARREALSSANSSIQTSLDRHFTRLSSLAGAK